MSAFYLTKCRHVEAEATIKTDLSLNLTHPSMPIQGHLKLELIHHISKQSMLHKLLKNIKCH